MSGIVLDRAILYLQSHGAGLVPGDAFAAVILEVGAIGFKVRVKSGKLKSINPPTGEGKSKADSHVFKGEDEARQYFEDRIESFRQVGFH